jgi:hypothetical protein
MTRRPAAVRVLCAASLLGALLLVASLASGATRRPAGAPGTWTVVGSGIRTVSGQIGTARTADGVLHVVWSRGGPGTPWELLDTTVSPAGKVSAPRSIVSGWSRIDDVDATAFDGKPLAAVFAGTKTDRTSDPTEGLNLATYDGSGWTVGSAAIYAKDFASSSVPSIGYTGRGDLVQAWSGGGQVYYHVGVDPNVRAQGLGPGGNVKLAGSNAGVVAASMPDAFTLAWCRSDGQAGLWSAELGGENLTHGAVRLRGSETTRCPAAARTALARQQHAVNASIAGSVAAERSVGFWYNAAQPPENVAGGSAIKQQVAIASAPDGSMWVGWRDATRDRLRFRRTDHGSDYFGAVVSVPLPPGQDSVYTLDLSAQDDRLDIVARATKGSAVTLFHTQTFPGLTVRATAKNGRVTVTVLDAASPVPGSTVRVGGRVLHTDAKGQVTTTLPKGTYRVVASKPKYVGATTSVRVAAPR